MRWLFILLVAGNFGYWAWNYLYLAQNPSTTKIHELEPSVADNQLKLLSEGKPRNSMAMHMDEGLGGVVEKDNMSETTAVAEPVVETPVATTMIPDEPTIPVSDQRAVPDWCLRIDSIEDGKARKRLDTLLTAHEAIVYDSGESEFSQKKFWVMIAPYANRGDASAAVKRLDAAKITDFYLVRGGDYINAISLGVFSSVESANRRIEQLKRIKIPMKSPGLVEIDLPAKRGWIETRLASKDQYEQLQQELTLSGYNEWRALSCQ